MAEYNRSSSSKSKDDVFLLPLPATTKQHKRKCNLKVLQSQRAEKRRRIYRERRSFTSSDTDQSMQEENFNAQSEHKIEADTEGSDIKNTQRLRRKKKKVHSSDSCFVDDLEDGRIRESSTDDSIAIDTVDEDLNENMTLTERLNIIAYETEMNEEQEDAMLKFINKWKSSLHLINREQIKKFTNSLAIEFMASKKPEMQAKVTYKEVFKVFGLPIKSKDGLLALEEELSGDKKLTKQKVRALSHSLVRSTKNRDLTLRNACREIMTGICDREIWQLYNEPEKIDNLHECLGKALPNLYLVLIIATVQKAKESKLKLKNPMKEVLYQVSLFLSGPQIRVSSQYYFDYNIFFNL